MPIAVASTSPAASVLPRECCGYSLSHGPEAQDGCCELRHQSIQQTAFGRFCVSLSELFAASFPILPSADFVGPPSRVSSPLPADIHPV